MIKNIVPAIGRFKNKVRDCNVIWREASREGILPSKLDILVSQALYLDYTMRYHHLRPNNVELPVPEGVQNFYYYHTNLVDGYGGAMVMDMLLSSGAFLLHDWSQKLPEGSYTRKAVERFYRSKHLRNATAGISAIVATTMFEFTTIGGNVSDAMDIPATAMGAILRTALRYSQICSSNKKD